MWRANAFGQEDYPTGRSGTVIIETLILSATAISIMGGAMLNASRNREAADNARREALAREGEVATMPGIAISRSLEKNERRQAALQEELDSLRAQRPEAFAPKDFDGSITSAEKELKELAAERKDLLDRLDKAQDFTRKF